MLNEAGPAWAVEVVAAWARGRCTEEGAVVPHSEVLGVGRLCAMSTAEIKETARVHGGVALLRRPDSDEWRAWTANGSSTDTSNSASTSTSTRTDSDAGLLLAAIPHYFQDHWWQQQQQQDAATDDQLDPCVLNPVQQLVVSRLAQVVFDAQTAAGDSDWMDPMMCVAAFRAATGQAPSGPQDLQSVRQVWTAETARMRRQLRRSSRSTRVRADYRAVMEDDGTEASTAAEGRATGTKGGSGKRTRGTAESPSKQARAAPIAELIDASGWIVRADGRPDAALVVRAAGFVPLVFPRTNGEPSHCLTDPRSSRQQWQTRGQAVLEFATDGFPAPVNPDAWLQRQRDKYVECLTKALHCRSVDVANVVQNSGCRSWDPFGAAHCLGCVQRKADCYCRFRHVRMGSRITAVLANGKSVTRYLLVPLFCDEEQTPRRSQLLVSPLRVPGWCQDLGFVGNPDSPSSLSSLSSFSDSGSGLELAENSHRNAGNRCRQAPGVDEWAEFYNLLMTASTLQPTLDMISGLVVDDDSVPAENVIEYPAHPRLGCSSAPCVRRVMASGNRQFCDVCSASIMGAYYACAMCWIEMCPQCFVEWDDSGIEARVLDHDRAIGVPPIALCKRFCRDYGQLRGAALHQRRQFLRVSLVSAADVAAVAQKVHEVVRFWPSLAANVDCSGPVNA
ncbi:hypothetical protein IWQ57_003546, partial [Coemansia nantahalensis]